MALTDIPASGNNLPYSQNCLKNDEVMTFMLHKPHHCYILSFILFAARESVSMYILF